MIHLFRNNYSSTSPLIYSFNKLLLSICQVLDTKLGAQIIAANKTYTVSALIQLITKWVFNYIWEEGKVSYEMGTIYREIWTNVQNGDFSVKMVLKLKPPCGHTSWVGEGQMSSRMIQREGRGCSGMRQGGIWHSTLGQVKHVDVHPVDTHYVLYCEGSKVWKTYLAHSGSSWYHREVYKWCFLSHTKFLQERFPYSPILSPVPNAVDFYSIVSICCVHIFL